MSILALVLLACGSKDGGDDDSNGQSGDDSAAGIDADKDGVDAADDCDDDDPAVHPGATEACNEIDDDCDGGVDEGVLLTSYSDEDSDDYGDDATAREDCEVPFGYATVGGDCDDHDEDVNPGADEVCDDADNDCDNLVDDDDDNLEGDDWYEDADGDGYGGDTMLISCEDPGKGYDNVSTDCDDGDDTVFPSAKEVCGDGVVQDCNRGSGDSFADCNGATVREPMAEESITLGSEQTIAFADLTGDAVVDVVLGAYLEESSGAFIFPGPIAGDLDAGDSRIELVSSENYGVVTVGTGRSDADAYDDLVVGTPMDYQKEVAGGAVYLLTGPVDTGDLSDPDLLVLGADSARIGSAVQFVGDLTADGTSEILVAAGGADGSSGADEGAVWILDGGEVGVQAATSIAVAELHGIEASQRFGAGVATGDLTGDGTDDLVVGNGEHTVQVAYVFEGPVTGTLTSDDADFDVNGAATDYGFGLAPLVVDLDGDGAADLVETAYDSSVESEHGGRVLAWNGPLTASVDDSTTLFEIEGSTAGDYVGGSLDATDIDGDGAVDLAVQGGVHWTVGNAGATTDTATAGWLFFGPIEGTVSDGTGDIAISDAKGDRFVRVAPDVDGDGRLELAWDTDDAVTFFVGLDGY